MSICVPYPPVRATISSGWGLEYVNQQYRVYSSYRYMIPYKYAYNRMYIGYPTNRYIGHDRYALHPM